MSYKIKEPKKEKIKAFSVNSKDLFDKKKNPHLNLSPEYILKNKKIEKKEIKENPYFVDGKDVSQFPIYYLEGDYGLTEAQEIALWQYGVDTGQIWKLQGWYGRNAQTMLNDGILHYPKGRTHDYYGNPIPTHEEAKKHKFNLKKFGE